MVGCQVPRNVIYKALSTSTGKCEIPVSNVSVNTPRKGNNIFTFFDRLPNGVVKAKVKHILLNDLEPLIIEQLSDIFVLSGTAPLNADISMGYSIVEYQLIKTQLELELLFEISDGPPNFEKRIVTSTSDIYSTLGSTFPPEYVLNNLLSYAIDDLKTQICSQYIVNQ